MNHLMIFLSHFRFWTTWLSSLFKIRFDFTKQSNLNLCECQSKTIFSSLELFTDANLNFSLLLKRTFFSFVWKKILLPYFAYYYFGLKVLISWLKCKTIFFLNMQNLYWICRNNLNTHIGIVPILKVY